jgi:hypothetical protein
MHIVSQYLRLNTAPFKSPGRPINLPFLRQQSINENKEIGEKALRLFSHTSI